MARKAFIKFKSDQSGSALIFSLLISSLLMIAALAIITVTNDDYGITESRSELSRAKYVADSAVEVITQKVYETEKKIEIEKTGERYSVPIKQTGSISGGYYEYTVTPPAGTGPYTIRVWARVELPNGDVVRKNVEAEYIYTPGVTTPPPVTGGPPVTARKALDYNLFQGGGYDSLGTLHLNAASFKGKGQVYSRAKVQLFEHNPNHDPLLFEGTVASLRDVQKIGNISSKVTPVPFDIDIPTPIVDWNYLKNNVKTINGDELLDENRVLDCNKIVRDDVIVFVNGDMTLKGDLTVNALIVATGKITVEGDYRYPNSDLKSAGIIAGSDLILKSDDTIPKKDTGKGPEFRGLAMAEDYVKINGEVKVTGSLIAVRDLTFTSGILDYDTTSTDNPVWEVIDNFGQQIFSNY